jgi:hypothetical protein
MNNCESTAFARALTFAATLALWSMAARGAEDDAPTLEALRAASPGQSLVATTMLFELHSDFLTNLDDALRWSIEHAERAEALLGTCAAKLPLATREKWLSALATYQVEAASRRDFDIDMHARIHFARLEDKVTGDLMPLSPGRRRALADASDAYRACAWPASDARNRRWIAERVVGIEQIEPALAARLVQLYQMDWPRLPIRTDVMYFESWSGADSWLPGHIRISSANPSNEGWAGVEVAFQQASHELMRGRGAVMWGTLTTTGGLVGFRIPPGLYHAVRLYATGQSMAAELGRVGVEYVPDILANERYSSWRDRIAAAFDPYLAGSETLEEACSALVVLVGLTNQAPLR